MAVWQLHESRGLGKENKVWQLEREGLAVGRSSECDIQILSQSVENRHSQFEWDQKKETYVIRDLGTVNGTFINGLLLRSGVATLHHGDSIRFGYEKGHIFRVKVVEPPPSPSPSPSTAPVPPSLPPSHTPHSTAATQTSPALSESNTPAAQSPQTSPALSESNTPAAQSPQVSAVQYVPVPSPAPTIIMQPGMPYLMPQPMPQVYSPQMPQIPLTSHVTGHMTPLMTDHMTPHVTGHMSPHMTSHMSPHMTSHMTPHVAGQMSPYGTALTPTVSSAWQFPAPPTTATSEQAATQAEPESQPASHSQSPQTASPRKDGRRTVSLSDAPKLSKASSLYGQPAWWGEEEPLGMRNKSEITHPEPQLLRDISPPRPRSSSDTSRSSRSSTRPSTARSTADSELQKQTHSKPLERSGTPSSAWTVGVGGRPRPSRTVPPKQRYPRSADSSPVRRGGGGRRSMSPSIPLVTIQKGAAVMKETTPLSRRATASKPPSGSKKTGRRSSPFPSTTAATVRSSLGRPVQKEQQPREDEPASERAAKDKDQEVVSVSTPNTKALKSQSEPQLGYQERKDQTFVVESPTEEERPSSARRQWSHEPTQPPNSLMLASIEARMRRLNKMAQNTYLSLSATKQSLPAPDHKTSATPQAQSCASPIPPLDQEQQLPEWKFFNKEVDSIFRNIRSVEKWLRDIDATVAAIQLYDGGERQGGGLEQVDFPEDFYSSSDAEGDEHFPDSVEDLCGSSD